MPGVLCSNCRNHCLVHRSGADRICRHCQNVSEKRCNFTYAQMAYPGETGDASSLENRHCKASLIPHWRPGRLARPSQAAVRTTIAAFGPKRGRAPQSCVYSVELTIRRERIFDDSVYFPQHAHALSHDDRCIELGQLLRITMLTLRPQRIGVLSVCILPFPGVLPMTRVHGSG